MPMGKGGEEMGGIGRLGDEEMKRPRDRTPSTGREISFAARGSSPSPLRRGGSFSHARRGPTWVRRCGPPPPCSRAPLVPPLPVGWDGRASKKKKPSFIPSASFPSLAWFPVREGFTLRAIGYQGARRRVPSGDSSRVSVNGGSGGPPTAGLVRLV